MQTYKLIDMFRVVIIVFVAIVFAPSSYGTKIPLLYPTPQIVGGLNASEGQFPYQISLRYKGNHICGGSILNKRWILTAAHCVDGFPIKYLAVYYGSIYLSKQKIFHPVKRVIVHPQWDPRNIKNDLALVEIEGEIKFTPNVNYILLEEQIIGIVNCTASGWGRLYALGPLPDRLQYIDLVTISNAVCRERWAKYGAPVGDCEICTLTREGEGVCNGDSGGPLVADGKLIGVVSWGNACANGIPDVFTRISCYVDWILQTISSTE